MKSLIITDTHGHRSLIKRIDAAIKKNNIELLLCCGDLTSSTTDNSMFLLEIERVINENKVRFLTICGNADSVNVRAFLIEKGWHLDEEEIDDRIFIGSDFGYEDEFVTKDVAGKILLTHVPPRYSVLEKPLKNCPLIHFAGHRHQVEQDKSLPSTRLVQVKSAQMDRAALFDTKTLAVTFIDI